ncbi:MAG: hypothetical protein Q7R99_04220 [bacterium]|nr:hypothetical protein [bacterium]
MNIRIITKKCSHPCRSARLNAFWFTDKIKDREDIREREQKYEIFFSAKEKINYL